MGLASCLLLVDSIERIWVLPLLLLVDFIERIWVLPLFFCWLILLRGYGSCLFSCWPISLKGFGSHLFSWWSIFLKGFGSRFFSLIGRFHGEYLGLVFDSKLYRKYPWVLTFPNFVNNRMGPLFDFVNPSFRYNLSLTKTLFSLSFYSIPSPTTRTPLFFKNLFNFVWTTS